MPFNKISNGLKLTDKTSVKNLHQALNKLNLPAAQAEADNEKTIKTATVKALKEFQEKNKLKADGKLTADTITALNTELHDKFIASDKTRTRKVQALLERLDLKISKDEKSARATGKSTRRAVEKFQKKNNLTIDGKMSEEVFGKLKDVVINEKLKAATQISLLQTKLQKVGKVAGLQTTISSEELKDKKLGATSQKFIEEFQQKYNLPASGKVDAATLHKLESVAASKGTFIKRIGTPPVVELRALVQPLRVNKISPAVNRAQNALSFLGYKIAEKEFKTQTYGKTTRKAVLEFQKKNNLAQTGHLEKQELKLINQAIIQANPQAADGLLKYRIRGSVRDEMWQRKPNMVIKIFEKLLDGESPQPLVTKKNFLNGFFDITYNPPINPVNKQIKSPFHLIVKLYEPIDKNPANDKLVETQNHYNVNRVHWVNFTAGGSPYLGASDFETVNKIVGSVVQGKVEDLHETETEKQISQLAFQTGLSTDDIMRLVLSYLAANNVSQPNPLSPEVFYAFIRQGLPPNLPSDLLRGTSGWETIAQMIEAAASGIVFLSDELQEQTIDNALSQNLVSQAVKLNRQAILDALKNKRGEFTLEKPILIGNQNLKTLLNNSKIKQQDYTTIAQVFSENKGINTGFWESLKADANSLSPAAVADFANTVEIGNATKNHLPTLQFFKSKIVANSQFKTASSFAKLNENEIAGLINENGKQVPDNIPGDTPAQRVAAYAAAIKKRLDVLFPAVSMVAEIKRGGNGANTLTNISDVETFLDANPELNFRQENIDKYLADKNITLNEKTLNDVKTVQRVYKLTAHPESGAALVDAGMHSSMQIYFAGKRQLTETLSAKGITEIQAARVYEISKVQYLKILGRLFDFRPETNSGNPAAIVPQTFSLAEAQAALGDIPNLELLFGSLDFCACEYCKSLYSPAAYFTDVLRFIGEHQSLVKKNASQFFSVKEILFQRRPDLGNIKLNCENTNTPLPYIDLVCEILENAVAPVNADFSFQTTLSAKELRAIPQYIRPAAYETLATANFPMNSSFNLFVEEARTYLNYLRVPRFELMEAFQNVSSGAKIPDDAAIAAEFFGISAFEKKLIINAKKTKAAQTDFWGFDAGQTSVAVSELMKRAKISYNELLELLLVRLINDPAAANRSEVVRVADSCDTSLQKVNNLTVEKFDLMHRFLRLWRKTGWEMWQLDLLLRSGKIGNDSIDAAALVNLKKFRQLQDKLNLPFEILLAFYNEINREVRIKADQSDVLINPLYKNLFQNVALTNPLDANFKAVDDAGKPVALNAAIVLGVNTAAPFNGYTPVPTILSTLALTQTDFDLLTDKTDNHLSVATLSTLLRYAYLARSLKLTVTDLLRLSDSTNVADPFADLQTTLDTIENLRLIRSSKLSLSELAYILNYAPDSPIGLRDETLIQLADSLRKILFDNKEKLEKLKLSSTDRAAILAFNADALAAMTNANLLTALAPLQTILSEVINDFKDAGFSFEESSFVINFSAASINAANKLKLVDNIKTIQTNLSGLLSQNENQIKSQIASSFGLTDAQSTILLENLTLAPAADSLLKILKDESLIEKNPDGSFKKEINETNFPAQFAALKLLHKVALLVGRLNFSDKNLEWFIKNQTNVGVLDFSALPVAATAAPDFTGFLNLFKFLDFAANFPEPENASLRSILDLSKNAAGTKPQIIAEISKLTQWSETDLTTIDAGLNLKSAAPDLDYAKADTFYRLKKCFDQMKLTGVDAQTMFSWAIADDDSAHDEAVAVQTRQAVKAKYEQEDWLDKITPLHDDLREKKRAALTAYHIENSQRTQPEKISLNGSMIPNPVYWLDSNGLYKYFLIDVEMSACQLTSRIKQAISSVQLFVQRCFLNLESRYVRVTEDEKADAASADAWSQWKWIKNYRVWEANRKIFFYPENWLEPELRDDKSPFFEELENEIMQNDVTKENVETAFLNYLHKVDEVSHLEVCGLYHEMENLTGDETMYERNIVHVIGRTKGLPHQYFYRSYDMNYLTWSAWEKIDVEIQGEQIVPVVYNRKLHLFWLQFMEKPMKTKKVPPAKPTSGPSDAQEALKVMEIELGWTIKNSAGWSPKKISKEKLVHPWERPHSSYNLKPYYLAKFNDLYLDIYLSTSKEFNETDFYDPYADKKVRLTKNPFNETFRPWHSSSFVFDGDVKSVEMKTLQGSYHLEPNVNNLVATDSYNYVYTNFAPLGKNITALTPLEFGPRLQLPSGMHYDGTRLTNNTEISVKTGKTIIDGVSLSFPNPNRLNVLENETTQTLLNGALAPFELMITQQDLQLNTISSHPLFYQDNRRAFFIKPEWEAVLNNYGQVVNRNRKYRFLPFYHPYTMLFIREFNRDGIDGLLNRKIQTAPQNFAPANKFNFSSYSPTAAAITDSTAQKDIVDFSLGGAYSSYNWELFFHAPLMIACRLMQNQKFEDAMNWFHYIFNPTNTDDLPTPQRYWITKPFFEMNSNDYRKQRIENILSNISSPENDAQLIAWKNNPFKPHLIARYRPVAYQRNVVMKYLDNLIAWGDMLFGRDTIEAINEASLLYLLAYEILGDRPQKVPNVRREDLTFNELEPKLDEFGNAKVDVVIEDTLLPVTVVPASTGTEPLPKIETFYFCIPNNDFLTKYWDTIEDRLFKIRHCMNIQGIVRQLPLFEPPIDPALLVKAAAAGIDISSVLNDLAAPTPHYRFRIVVQKAIEFCTEVRNLGEKLLAALQNKDIEELALLRNQHEIGLLEAVKEVRKKQIDEAVETIGALNTVLEITGERENYFSGIPRTNTWEDFGAGLHAGGIVSEIAATVAHTLAAGIYLIPQFPVGAAGMGGTPTALVEFGGDQPGKAASKFGALFEGLGKILHSTGSMLETQGAYSRRDDENKFQAKIAGMEKNQIQFQINAATIRQAIAEKELENQELEIENAKAVDDYMRNKYTNRQLYSWMITQISGVYFQAYQLAFEMAKKAEKCFQYELGLNESNYIQFGYWDSLKKGLVAGDKLAVDLRRLESAYLDQNKREFEITKHISLAQMFPASLIKLKETGVCTVSLPEWIFDMDYPGHYLRRIKNVSISVPCVVGAYASVSCTLSLLRNEARIVPTGNYDKTDENDPRFRTMFGSISSIATTHAQADSGMFELNFNDDRYLPFEGAGVISDWQIEMPPENNHFDFASLSDVILHISYTARNGGGLLKTGASANLQNILPNSTARLFSLKHEFGSEFYKFIHPENTGDQEFVITLKPEHFPFFVRGKLNSMKIKNLDLFVDSLENGDFTTNIKVTNKNMINNLTVSPDANFGGAHHLAKDLSADAPNALGEIRIKLKQSAAADFKSLTDDKIADLYLLLRLGL